MYPDYKNIHYKNNKRIKEKQNLIVKNEHLFTEQYVSDSYNILSPSEKVIARDLNICISQNSRLACLKEYILKFFLFKNIVALTKIIVKHESFKNAIFSEENFYSINKYNVRVKLEMFSVKTLIYKVINDLYITFLKYAKEAQCQQETLAHMKKIFDMPFNNYAMILSGIKDELYIENAKELEKKEANIFKFANIYYDFLQCEFKNYIVEDYIFHTSGYEFIIDENTQNIYKKLIDKIFPDMEEKNYVFSILGNILSGSLSNDKIFFLIGDGGNGKTLFINLLKKMFGKFCVTLPQNFLTNNLQNAEQATPMLASIEGKRLAVINETVSNSFKNATIKNLCGNEIIVSRRLYREPTEFFVNCTFLVVTNHTPKFDFIDEALERRIKFIKFNSKFVSEINQTNESKNIFLKDETLLKKVISNESFSNCMFIDTISSYQKEKGVGCKEPISFRFEFFKTIESETMVFLDFLKKNLKHDNSVTSVITCEDLFSAYYKENKSPNKYQKKYRVFKTVIDEFVKLLTNNIQCPINHNYRSHKIVKEERRVTVWGWSHLKIEEDK